MMQPRRRWQPSRTGRRCADLSRIGLVSLVVRDYEEAITYYRDVLGFRLIEDTPLEKGKRWVVVAPDDGAGTGLLLARTANDAQKIRIGNQSGGRVFMFLYTDDVARDYPPMKAAGVTFLEEPRQERYGRVAVFSDLYGNRRDLIDPAMGRPGS